MILMIVILSVAIGSWGAAMYQEHKEDRRPLPVITIPADAGSENIISVPAETKEEKNG